MLRGSMERATVFLLQVALSCVAVAYTLCYLCVGWFGDGPRFLSVARETLAESLANIWGWE